MAKDLYHDAVKTALMKEGWKIIEEGFELQPDDNLTYFVDMLAEKYVLARKKKEVIIVEVKTFSSRSDTYQFHSAIGQYITYHTAIEYTKLDLQLYLAVPKAVYINLFQRPFIQYLIEKYKILLMPFDPQNKTLLK